MSCLNLNFFLQVLRLEKSGEDADTESLFAEVWGRGQPVVVGEVTARLDAELWQPGCFARKEIPIVAESVLEKYKVIQIGTFERSSCSFSLLQVYVFHNNWGVWL